MTLIRPDQDGFFMPAEWAPQEAVWMIWPYRTDNWRLHGKPAQETYANIAKAILKTTPVMMAVPEKELSKAQAIMPAEVKLVVMESDDAWMRDVGPTVLINDKGERRSVNWTFNAWGGKEGGLYENWDQDQEIAKQVSDFHSFPYYNTDLILEGGSIHVDGEGTLLVTEECLLNRNRNPHLTKAQIEQTLSQFLKVKKIIWLPFGVYNDETDGHIDNMCCFIRPGEVALHWTDNENDPQYARSLAALNILKNEKDAQNRSLKIWKIPSPSVLYATQEETESVEDGSAIERAEGSRLAGSYVNFLITNKQIILPFIDPKMDKKIETLFQEIYPDYIITGVNSREVLLGGGNIHCITQQIPR